MQFDSTMYLMYYLKEKTKLEESYIENCFRFLAGFVIEPGSIKYDEESNLLTLSMSLPNSDLKIHRVIINPKEYQILISASIQDIIISIQYSLFMPKVCYSILFDKENNSCSGIYYYNPDVFATLNGKYMHRGQYAYYDANTLKIIQDLYLLNQSKNDLIDLIGTTSEKITNLGFVPDITIWEEKQSSDKERSHGEIIDDINKMTREINYNDIIEKLSKFSKEHESSNEPISFRK